MTNRDLIVIGASAGGIEALDELLAGLSGDLAASVLLVMHMPPAGGPALQRILRRHSDLDVVVARDGDSLQHGRLYVAAGDHHLLVGSDEVQVRRGPRENGHRPAVDPLFRSAAAYFGPRVIGVILSGGLSDGTAGLLSIRQQGGLALIQDPAEAIYDSMPRSAIETVGADYVAPAAAIGHLLADLVGGQADPSDRRPGPILRRQVGLVEGPLDEEHLGRPSPWPCPDCNGVLWEIDDGPVLRFRCRVGHAWEAESLLEQQAEGVEGAVWMALRVLEDRAALSRKLAERAEEAGRRLSAMRYRGDLDGMTRSIAILRRLLVHHPLGEAPSTDDAAAGRRGEEGGDG